MTLEEIRWFYAQEIRFAANIRSDALIRAFATVPRERFLGDGPWRYSTSSAGAPGGVAYQTTPDADPRHVYHNVPISIDPTRDLNNGQPGSLAMWMDSLEIQSGESVFHVGCGTGYFTAILAHVVGPAGRVVAVEVDEGLAARAQNNLREMRQVEVHCADGGTRDPGPVDIIVVNAGATHPCSLWLDRLKPNGRLLLPLTTMTPGSKISSGLMLAIQRAAEPDFHVRFLSPVAIYPLAGRDPLINAQVAKSLAGGRIKDIRRLRRDAHKSGEQCWLHLSDCCISQ